MHRDADHIPRQKLGVRFRQANPVKSRMSESVPASPPENSIWFERAMGSSVEL